MTQKACKNIVWKPRKRRADKMSKNRQISPVLYSKCMNRNKYQKFIPQQNNVKAKVCGFVVVTFSLFEEVHYSTLSVFCCFIVVCSLLRMIYSILLTAYRDKTAWLLSFLDTWYVSGSQHHLLTRQRYKMVSPLYLTT